MTEPTKPQNNEQPKEWTYRKIQNQGDEYPVFRPDGTLFDNFYEEPPAKEIRDKFNELDRLKAKEILGDRQLVELNHKLTVANTELDKFNRLEELEKQPVGNPEQLPHATDSAEEYLIRHCHYSESDLDGNKILLIPVGCAREYARLYHANQLRDRQLVELNHNITVLKSEIKQLKDK